MKKTIRFILNAIVCMLWWPSASFAAVSFETGQYFSTPGSWFEVVATGDVNHDGRKDIVAATGFYFSPQYDYRLLVYIQSPSGSYPTVVTYPYPSVMPGINSIAINDVNNDSLNDVVIGYDDSIAIFFQNTAGTLDPWISYYSGGRVDDLKVADLNNDSYNDIVVCHHASNYLRVFYQTINGFSSKTYPKPTAGFDEIEVGDVNSDGLNDVVFMAGQGQGGIHIFTQNTLGTLNNYTTYFPGGVGFQFCNAIVIADLNGDGANDIAGTKGWNGPEANLVIWFQDTATHLLKPAYRSLSFDSPENIEVADFDCDGSPDIVMNHSAYNITVWSRNDSGNYTSYKRFTIIVDQHPNPEGLAVEDINSDGKIDILSVGNFTTIQILYNASKPNFISSIDTIINIDTIPIRDKGYSYYYAKSSMNEKPGYYAYQTDSFKVIITDLNYKVRIDSIYFTTGFLCHSINYDVVIDSSIEYHHIQKSDTLFWSTSRDTFYLSKIDIPASVEIKPSPNPFNSFILLNGEIPPSSVFIMYDFLGQQILQQPVTSSTIIHTESLAKGIYYYNLLSPPNKSISGKMMKQ